MAGAGGSCVPIAVWNYRLTGPTKVIVDVVIEAVPPGEMNQVCDQLPAEFDGLFEIVDRESDDT